MTFETPPSEVLTNQCLGNPLVRTKLLNERVVQLIQHLKNILEPYGSAQGFSNSSSFVFSNDLTKIPIYVRKCKIIPGSPSEQLQLSIWIGFEGNERCKIIDEDLENGFNFQEIINYTIEYLKGHSNE